MDHEEVKAFWRWLEEASETELLEKKERINQLLDKLHDRDVKRDARMMIRAIDAEILARALAGKGQP